jgi:diguanylate cyclase (GGDEF)-like protein/PAS domain S-box-containing protein
MGIAAIPWDLMSVNLPNNMDSTRQQEILDALPVLVFLERAGRIVFANAEARQMLGLAESAWLERPVEDVLWGLYPGTAEPQTLLKGTRRGSPFHATMPVQNGTIVPVEGTYCILNPEQREAVIVAHPGGRERAPNPGLMEDVLSSIPEAVAIEHGNHLLYTNPAFTRMFGYTAEECSGGSLRRLIVPETRQNELAMMERTVDEQGRAIFETVRLNRRGELLDVAMQVAPLLVNGAKTGYVFTFRDIGDRRQTEAKLEHDALHDVLTGLPNRTLFIDRLTLSLSRRLRRRDRSCGVLFVDLDRFKEINDTLGHAAGDELLMEVARRLCAVLRPQDSAARLGGDEFALLVDDVQAVGDLEAVARRILGELSRPVDIFGQPVQVVASIGVAMAGPDHTAPELLIRDADFAMYRAKQDGGGRIEIFDKHLEVQVTTLQERERELRMALSNRQFSIWYQPIYRLSNGKLEGFESLLRWRRNNGEIDGIRDLLEAADDTGLSITLGRETMNAVCERLQGWSGRMPQGDLTVSMNVTERQFYHPEMVAQLKRGIAASGVNPARLLFEVAESTLNENPDAAVAIMQRMVDCNVRLAIDNFGAGLAPLNHLVRLPVEVVKLAPKLTMAATSKGREQMVLESLIHLGHRLGVQVVAQGIETTEQLQALARMGCEFGQGHFLSQVLDPERTEQLAAHGWASAPGA